MIQAVENISTLQFNSQLIQLRDAQQGGQRFLGFPLNAKLDGLLPLGDLQGVINVTLTNILPVPQVADSLLGIINWRGKATWIVDLASLLGSTHWCRRELVLESGMAMLVQVKSETVGLLVKQVNTIETYEQQCLPVSESMFSPQLRSFVKGYFVDSQGKPRILLDVHRLVIQAIA